MRSLSRHLTTVAALAMAAGLAAALTELREAGLVTVRSEGKQRLYALDPAPLRELDDWLEPYRDLWAQRLDALDTEIARGRRSKRNGEPE